MDLAGVRTLAEEKRYHEALEACDLLLRDDRLNRTVILRERASVLARSGDYEAALRDRETIIAGGEPRISDYYLAADDALSAGRFAQATAWLLTVLRLGTDSREAWFSSAAHFLLAYARMELEQYEDALADLDRAIAEDPDAAMPLPGMCGLCGHLQLREEIDRRMARRRKARE